MNNPILTSFQNMSKLERLVWLRTNLLFRDTNCCIWCTQLMKTKHCTRAPDEYVFKCTNYHCTHFENMVSVRTASFFEGLKCQITDILHYVYLWALNFQQYQILRLCSISRSTATKIEKLVCSRIKFFFSEHPIKLGGEFTICQVDETMINFKCKSHRGRSLNEQIWALVIVDCSTKPALGYIEVVSDRSSATLIPIISRVVRNGTTIISDEWKSYNSLSNTNNFVHKRICHKYNFVCPETGVHTQNVESYNNKIKIELKKRKGMVKEKHEDFLLEFMFKERIGCNVIEVLINLLKF